ncbi:MAG: vitamin K epoxide reductase family protein [Verrucomicrobiales bacterium]|nr:vitamin K epoxide reductase family protein [Verrucomicrobiales bacterium]
MTDNSPSPKGERASKRSYPHLALALLLLASLTGAALSATLALAHYAGKEAGSPLAGVCGPGGSCDQVLNSRWSLFPPGPAISEASAPVETSSLSELVEGNAAISSGLPVAVLGLFYYSTIFLWFAVLGPRALDPGFSLSFFRLPLHLIVLSCLGSLAFIGIMKFTIGAWCPLCLASHACNFVILAVVVRSFLRQRKRPTEGTCVNPATPRLVAAVVLLISFALLAEWAGLRGIGLARDNRSLEAFATSAATLEMAYLDLPQHEMNIRDDDSMIQAAPGKRMTLVVFGDAECPHCAAFDYLLYSEVLPLFRGHLRVVFKHFPADQHEHAFKAATALEAARIQGAFEKAHHKLFKRRAELADFDYRAFAGELGLDPDRFLEDMAAPETRDRIHEDKETLLAALGSKSAIPAVFLNGRLLDGRMRALPGFWESRAEALRRSRTQYGLDWGNSEFDRFPKNSAATSSAVSPSL